jgi:hypothetical protein
MKFTVMFVNNIQTSYYAQKKHKYRSLAENRQNNNHSFDNPALDSGAAATGPILSPTPLREIHEQSLTEEKRPTNLCTCK